MSLFKKIRSIERAAYDDAPDMMQMQHVRNMSDLAEYCECSKDQVKVMVGEDYYFIIADHDMEGYCEIVDFASSSKRCGSIFRVMSYALKILKGKEVHVDARETTSYPLLVSLAKRGKVSFLHDEAWAWGDETMHEIIMRVTTE